MSQAHIAHNRFELELDGDERQRRVAAFLADLFTARPGSNPARPDANGVIEREIAPDLQNAAGYGLIDDFLHKVGVEVEYDNTPVQKH